jgi:hypothetical protein
MKTRVTFAAFPALLCALALGSQLAHAAAVSASVDGPTIMKDYVTVRAFTVDSYQKNFDVWSWLPTVRFRVNGPIASGSTLWVEFNLPTGPWVKFDCKTEEIAKDHWWQVEDAGGRDIGEDKGTTYTGPVDFAIHVRNDLASTDSVLFKGKIKVAKAHSNETGGEKFAQHFVYYVDQDWNLPIGYVFYTKDDVHGWDLPTFNAAFWARGEGVEIQPHLFFEAHEVGKMSWSGTPVGQPSADPELTLETTQYVDDSLPQKAKWARVVCTFPNVKGWNKTGQILDNSRPGQVGAVHILKDHPGDYEVKVLWRNKIARSIKFTVRDDGTLDDAVNTANHIGDIRRMVVPVKIIGDQDGNWDKDAWKTDAFYGNPLTGFTAAQ